MSPRPPAGENGHEAVPRGGGVPARWLTALAILPVAAVGVLLLSLGPLWRAYQVEQLLSQLDYADPEACKTEVEELAALGEDAVDRLALWIADRDHLMHRWKAALVLSQIPSERVAPLLLQALEDEKKSAQQATQSALVQPAEHSSNPETDRLLWEEGLALVEREDWKAVVAVFDRIIREDRGLPEAYFQRAKAFYHLGDYDACLRDCQITRQLDWSRFDTLMLEGICYHEQGRREVVQARGEQVQGHPRHALRHIGLAQNHWKLACDSFARAYSHLRSLYGRGESSPARLRRVRPGLADQP